MRENLLHNFCAKNILTSRQKTLHYRQYPATGTPAKGSYDDFMIYDIQENELMSDEIKNP